MRVALVGAGSLDFTGPLLRSLMPVVRRHSLHISLCDHDPQAMEDMPAIARALADESGTTLEPDGGTSVAEVVGDAQFVVLTLNHGGLTADKADIHNALDHGLFPKHVDTIGPAGWLRALRMGAFMHGLLPQTANDAVVLDLSNPLALIVRMAVRRGLAAFGFCHGAMNRAKSFQDWLGLSEPAQMQVWGTNHLAWLASFRLGGRDLYPDLIGFLQHSPDHAHWRYNVELYERHGMMPVLEAQHCGDFFEGLNDEQALRDYGLHLWEGEPRQANAAQRSQRRADLAAGRRPLSDIGPSCEGVAEVIDALLGGSPHRGILNAPLPEAANGMPAGAIVETWMTVNEGGADIEPPPTLPQALQDHLARIALQQNLAAEAFETGDMSKLLEAMCLEPNIRGEDVARSMLTRALSEHAGLLGSSWRL